MELKGSRNSFPKTFDTIEKLRYSYYEIIQILKEIIYYFYKTLTDISTNMFRHLYDFW